MSKNSDMVNLKRLIDIGKDKGYITFEELNDDLSEEMVSSEEQTDDLMMMFQDLDIMVIDEASKNKIEKANRSNEQETKLEDIDSEQLDISDAPSRVADPVKMYLK
ncbi:MAG TPA: RNA polymerase sigma factor RpoD, partial [Desulfobacteraceae bacterium]|nr:RNA polymerase sigma factor RpoD [Desulfobacteraceae bacterium]